MSADSVIQLERSSNISNTDTCSHIINEAKKKTIEMAKKKLSDEQMKLPNGLRITLDAEYKVKN